MIIGPCQWFQNGILGAILLLKRKSAVTLY
jgi:hypothetical protein